MAAHLPVLTSIRVASPCPADWDGMAGDDRIRHCGQCDMNVYNLSDMTRAEAEALVTKAEGRLCIRYYQRKDGTVLTRDCPTGVRIRRRRRRGLMAGLAASLSMVAGGVFGAWTRPIASAQPKPVVWDEPLMGAVEHRPDVEPTPPADPIMGEDAFDPAAEPQEEVACEEPPAGEPEGEWVMGGAPPPEPGELWSAPR